MGHTITEPLAVQAWTVAELHVDTSVRDALAWRNSGTRTGATASTTLDLNTADGEQTAAPLDAEADKHLASRRMRTMQAALDADFEPEPVTAVSYSRRECARCGGDLTRTARAWGRVWACTDCGRRSR